VLLRSERRKPRTSERSRAFLDDVFENECARTSGSDVIQPRAGLLLRDTGPPERRHVGKYMRWFSAGTAANTEFPESAPSGDPRGAAPGSRRSEGLARVNRPWSMPVTFLAVVACVG
jgi:hypothetical protein